jgi:hypothetical protein
MIENAYVEFLDEYDSRKSLESKTEKVEAHMTLTGKTIRNDKALKESMGGRINQVKNELLNMVMNGLDNSKIWGAKIETVIKTIKLCIESD